MNHFTTPKGTELPLMLVKGKPYMQVAHRMIWFREEHPRGSIKSEMLAYTETYAIFKAQILDPLGLILAEAHKKEDKTGFGDYLEKAETGAKGRALADCGFGTQFALADYDEEHRIVDSPQNPKGDQGAKRRETPHSGSGNSNREAAPANAPIKNREPAPKDPAQNQRANEPKAQDPYPKPQIRDETPISFSMTLELDQKILATKRDQQKTYEWICKKYHVQEMVRLKRWQFDEIMDLLKKPAQS